MIASEDICIPTFTCELSQAEQHKLRKQHEELESKNHPVDLVSLMKDKLQASYQEKMDQMSSTVKKNNY